MEQSRLPVRFNALKHHLRYLLSAAEEWKEQDRALVSERLLELGNNLYDIYTGELEVEILCESVASLLRESGIRSGDDYRCWLGLKRYATVTMSDCSGWILREGRTGGFRIHLHPARNQPLVRRVKASHMKTAVALLLESGVHPDGTGMLTTGLINRVRGAWFGLSPVKSIDESRKIMETIRFLTAMGMSGIPPVGQTDDHNPLLSGTKR